ncbi:hypothetical protein [Polyangium aurulentum]|uniref:hypothetical protein n=1 Tax=Polyangium aurulentum TaxID=2567896 RepID=UPI0010ADE96C|nr:hypothetical protein [Polyangium aurulentum]UQA61348.1 hypothetical protein E8A73_013080 [Polyangium aurulentum]
MYRIVDQVDVAQADRHDGRGRSRMPERRACKPAIAIVGGDGRAHHIRVSAVIRSFPSGRYGGNGSIRRAVAAIDGGKVELVVLLVRWLGHSEYDAVVKACKSAQVLFLIVAKGSVTAHQQEVQEYLNARACAFRPS